MNATEINDLRQKVLNNEPFDKTRLAEAVKALVGDRLAEAQKESAPSKGKRKSVEVNLDDLL